jgi:pyridoxine 4-dehydrogenase
MPVNKTITIAGKTAQPFTVNRPGYGTMRLTGPMFYGEPADREGAKAILKKGVDNGVNFLDTADYYGDDVTNRLIVEALFPYTPDLVICTKVGGARRPNASWYAFNSPENLRTSIERNLTTLKLEQIQLVHFRIIPGTDIPLKESMDAMFDMQKEGKIRHVGISNVNREELETVMKMGQIASVENMYGHAQRTTITTGHMRDRGGEEVLDICEENNIPLVPYFSLHHASAKKDSRISVIAEKYGVTDAQVNIAWLIHKSPWILPIPGTTSLAHLQENISAADITLTEEDMFYLH